MAGKVLTARSIEALRPRAKRTEYPDAGCPGLYLIVQPGGGRSWALRYRRPGGKSAKLTLGAAGEDGLSLAAARHAAAAARLRLDQGADPAPKRLPVTPQHYDPERGDAIEAAVASFLELHAHRKTRPATAWAAERTFNRLVLPVWRGRSIHDIRRRDVIDLVEHIATDRPYLANRCLGVLSKLFNWLIARDRLANNPAAGVERPHKEVPRSRTLSEKEIVALWRACDGDGPFGAALKILLLTGARRNEVSRMTWAELDEERRAWILPKERAKNGREHVTPLPVQAWKLIQSMPRIAGCPYVFTADGRSPIIGWARVKTRNQRQSGARREGLAPARRAPNRCVRAAAVGGSGRGDRARPKSRLGHVSRRHGHLPNLQFR